jgi:NADH-quinone oxidoreductase subunit F
VPPPRERTPRRSRPCRNAAILRSCCCVASASWIRRASTAIARQAGYAALERAIELGPEAVIREVIESGLVGRGGALFPTGRKWDAVRRQPATPHFLVCNADESEPGTFKDRVLMCGDPFAVVEAMTIAAYATGCEHGFVYVRAEYPLAHERMQHAIDAARAGRVARREHPRARLLVRPVAAAWLGCVHLRRGDGAVRIDRRLPRRAAAQAASSRSSRGSSASRPS